MSRRTCLAAAIAIATVAWVEPVRAEPRVHVRVAGPGSKAIERRIVEEIGSAAEIVSSESEADAVITATSKRGKGKRRNKTTTSIRLVDLATGDVLVEGDERSIRELADAMQRVTVPAATAPPGRERRSQAAAEPEPEPRLEPPEPDPSARAAARGPEPDIRDGDARVSTIAAPRDPLFSATVAALLGGRRFAYNDALTPNLRGYQIFGVPLASIDLELYPFARRPRGLVRALGIHVGYERAIVIASETTAGASVDTSWSRIAIDARLRVRTAGPRITLALGWGRTDFSFAEGTGFDDELPSATYDHLTVGVGARFPSGRWSFAIDAAWMPVLSADGVMDRFPRATAQGVDVGASATLALSRRLDLRLGLDYARWFYTMNPEPGDDYVAGGALDEMLTFQTGVAYAF